MGKAVLAALLVIATSRTASGTEIVDSGTMRNSMRSCPANMFIVGVDLDGNRLLCSDMFGPYTPTAVFETVDGSAVASGTKSCPTGYGVTGLSPVRNRVSCAHRGKMETFIDQTTVRSGMRACPVGTVVTGIGFTDNRLLCGRRVDFCFGGLGQRCGITKEGFDTPLALCVAGRCYVNAGSWIHDECCWRFPNGIACRAGPDRPHDGHCVTEFGKAVSHLALGYNWRRNVDFNVPNTTGNVTFVQYCAPNGTIVHRSDVARCCGRASRAFDPFRDTGQATSQNVSPVELVNGNARVCRA
jgi:hypothetical protein